MEHSVFSQLAANFVSITGAEQNNQVSFLTQSLADTGSISQLLQVLFDAALVLGAMLAITRITYGGFLYMTSDIANNKTTAIKTIREAFIGLILLLAMVLILQQINPNILNLDFAASFSK